jgi:predicted metalloprotease with PDZ domain
MPRFTAFRPRCFTLTVLVLLLLHCLRSVPAAAPLEGRVTLDVEVDARDLPRRLLHTTIQLPCPPGPLAFWYPKWIQGTHGKSGPLVNVAGLRLEDQQGRSIPWHRDDIELFRVVADIPEAAGLVTVRLDTICNEAGHERSGHLSFGNPSLGIINWNTCLLYPEGPPAAAIAVHLRLRLPAGWSHASALAARDREAEAKGEAEAGVVTFEPVSLDDLVDSPLIAGAHLRSLPLDAGLNPPATFHVASESPDALKIDGEVAGLYGRVVREAGALFGACPYPAYHFLVTCSDDLGYLGLEHLTSSLNGVRQRDLLDSKTRRGWVANLIPHEYVHAWCGKYRRPAGMCTPDFHTPMKTDLLWVYEGLGEYLGELLMVRAGLVEPGEYREMLAWTLGDLVRRDGRRWRSLEDTAIASELLRAPSPNWNDLRRSQDYYQEGALLWLEADTIIRERSHGERSLDDFCKRFLGPINQPGRVVPYDRAEIIALLNDLADHDWTAFFDRRVSAPMDALPLDVVARCGYRLSYASKPSGYLQYLQDKEPGFLSARDSLGMTISREGRVNAVNPGSAADRAGVLAGVQILGVNGWRFTRERFLEAIDQSQTRHSIEFLVAEGERIRNLVVDYAEGPRYPELIRDPARPDLLGEILKPRASSRGN